MASHPLCQIPYAITCLVASLAMAWTPALADPTVRVEAVGGYDTNATRSEGAARGGALSRVVLDLSDAGRPAKDWRLHAAWHGGARRFWGGDALPCRDRTVDPRGEDALFQRLEGALLGRLVGRLTLGAQLDLRDRTTRDPCHPRDYTHLRGTVPLALAYDDFSVELAGVVERFHYKPDPRYDATSAGARLRLGYAPGRWHASAFGEWLDRRYRPDTDGATPGDRVLRLGLGLRYAGPGLWAAQYAYSVNDSTRDDGIGGYGRHALTVTGTASLPLGLLLSGRISLVRILHDRALLLPDDQTLQDEGRSAVALRLERPIDDHWSAVAHGGWWGSPFETGPDYDRWLGLLGISFGAAP